MIYVASNTWNKRYRHRSSCIPYIITQKKTTPTSEADKTKKILKTFLQDHYSNIFETRDLPKDVNEVILVDMEPDDVDTMLKAITDALAKK